MSTPSPFSFERPSGRVRPRAGIRARFYFIAAAHSAGDLFPSIIVFGENFTRGKLKKFIFLCFKTPRFMVE
jgi:hypothetical protein